MQITIENRPSWLDRPLSRLITLNWETVIFIVILGAAVFTRFHLLEPRVMSHDETSHVYFSWLLYQGRGYQHDPITHGPFQFHILALSYFLFGDNDFTARVPAVLFSIATIGFMWFYRRYLGKAGALVAAILLTISPYMLFYGRYVRNEAFVALFGVITLWAILRYLELGSHRYLFFLTAATALHYTTKETSYIYSAQALLFLAFYFFYKVTQRPWKDPKERSSFIRFLIVGFVLLAVAAGATYYLGSRTVMTETGSTPVEPGMLPTIIMIALGVLAGIALLAAAFFLIKGYTWTQIREERSFDLLILQGTLILPLLSAIPLELLGWGVPTNVTSIANLTTIGILQMGSVLLVISLIAVAIGLWWNKRVWLGNAALFYAIFTVLYTTIFTNGAGFFTGMLGGLGYWLAQQEVQRGSQPWYYYAFVQIPIYEYLPALGSLLALGLVSGRKRPSGNPAENIGQNQAPEQNEVIPGSTQIQIPPVLGLLGFWTFTSLLAYTVAGEKMPWLTVHMAFPMILTASWALGQLIESVDWRFIRVPRGILTLVLLPVFLLSFSAAFGSIMGTNRPFQGQELAQLQATSTFLMSILAAHNQVWSIGAY